MNDKTNSDGSPRVQFLESVMQDDGISEARVILPITDPYVVHHGALGSFATVYVDDNNTDAAADVLRRVPGVEEVLNTSEAVKRYLLPKDRIGELVVLADRHTVLGRTPGWHDLSSVQKGLRSHGGLHERQVPFIINQKLQEKYAARLNSGEADNYEMLDFLCNGIAG